MNRRGLYSISLDQNFLKTLAIGILKEIESQPLQLRDYTIFLPTRRAIRELKKLFLDHHNGPSLILPKMIALGEISEEELNFTDLELISTVKIPPLKRQAMLAKLIKAFGGQGYEMSTPQAFRLASDLMGLIDQVILEDLNFEDLKTLVSENYAEHWQVTLNFLEIITHHWPKILEEEGLKESADLRRNSIEKLIESWGGTSPEHPIILAGSTGSLKLTRDLMKGILKLPQGRVVLPGFRTQDYETALHHPTHPQHTLSVSVKECGEEVKEWQVDKSFLNLNIETVSQALLPELNPQNKKLGLSEVHRIDCSNELEEASSVALILREAVEDPLKTAMLVTPDRTLARRVASHLKRWDIKVDDSSGKPLSETPVGILTRLTSELCLNPNDPGLLLSLLKHPLTRLGMKVSDIRSLTRLLEKKYIRGALVGADLLEDLKSRVIEIELKNLIEIFQTETCELREAFKKPTFNFKTALSLHQKLLNKISTTDEGDTLILNRNGGPQLESLLNDLSQNADSFPEMERGDYPALLNLMMSGVSVRNTIPAHPRISILGPLEARLLTADRIILAGLNEGTWPLQPETGPWLSRPMRVEFGLQPLEQRIGLSAHDFLRAFGAKEVFLTRARKVGGTPTIPCRWLLRLETLLGTDQWSSQSKNYLRWGKSLDTPNELFKINPPEPKPPLHLRPKHLSVTQIETWMRDPYAIYARHILKLKKLDPLKPEPTAADRGTIIHKCLERYKKEGGKSLNDLLEIGAQEFKPLSHSPFVTQFWWPRFIRLAEWFVEEDATAPASSTKTEIKGTIDIGGFVVSAKADRIDFQGTHAVIIDYKTGSTPSAKSVKLGYSCQLPLEGVILKYGGFETNVSGIDLQYWTVSGRENAGEIKTLSNADELIQSAEVGVKELVDQFKNPETPYRSQPRPEWKPAYSDYDHLARTQEWGAG